MDDFSPPVSSGSNMGSTARFPKLDECAHFHYEHVELGTLEVSINKGSNDSDSFDVVVTSGNISWILQRTYDNFVMFDKQLHRCIFDRKFSSLAVLSDTRPKNTCDTLQEYLNRFSQLNHEGLNCSPVLNWLQIDNRGRRILVPESDSCPINTPAVAAAYVVKPYVAQAPDELSFMVGDMISVIDMPPAGESNWWRGKHGFAVGFFPAECVAVIGDKVPRHLTVSNTVRSKLPVKPVLRKHGKLIAFFRSFILNRPSRRRLKQSGILRERVFGCDLGEHLLNSGQDVPTVLKCCGEFIENHGLVDGIYRLSGVTSNIQRLRNAFDEDRVPALHSDESILQDIHSVASLLKMYFRELPNPLCTYQLYSTFVSAVQANNDAERLRRMRDAVRKLPPPHYRTLEYLMRHLVRVAARGAKTGMTPRNVAIVWAPNLLRCKELEVGGVAALQGVGVQAVVTEFLICYAELIFGEGPVGRPKSLAITTSARLLSLEEARNRNPKGEPDYIEVGAGPAGLPLQYHTVIELPRKRNGSKRSPSLNWRALFGRSGPETRPKPRQDDDAPPQIEIVPTSINSLRRLRPVKSADSLDGEDGLGPLGPPTRPCGHSRSVSHDSYFDHLTDGPNTTSPLDLSEIQINFDLEEREMRMFSEEESGIPSIEASPRRQRAEGTQCANTTGGSKRKRSRLEERLHCDVELRFIDSQSPDQVMISADIHNMETPSPLPTPGYLPLLSEASTPLSPATLQSTPISSTPLRDNSPRISFRSFTLPLDIDDERSNSKKLNRASVSSDKTSDPSHRLSLKLIDQNTAKSCETMHSRDTNIIKNESLKLPSSLESNVDLQDQEMIPCDRLLTLFDEADSKDNDKSESNSQKEEIHIESLRNDVAGGLQFSNMTDLDSPMSCEHTLEDLPDSGFVVCDSSDKLYSNTETPQMTVNSNDSGEWVFVDRQVTSGSSNAVGEGTINPAIATDVPQLRSMSEHVSRTSLDLTMGSTADNDTSCIGVSDFTESLELNQESGKTNFDISNKSKNYKTVEPERSNETFVSQRTFMLADCSSKLTNNDPSMIQDEENNQSSQMEHEVSYCKTDENVETKKSDTMDNQRCFNKCQSVEHSPQKKFTQVKDKNDEIDIVIPSENAAEAREIAQVPEGASETTSLDSTCTFSNASSPVEESVVLRDTATILQELALQRLSGGADYGATPGRRKYDNEGLRDRRSFDSEIVRERKMKQEAKSEDTNNSHLPPCLRARHARATRAALSRSLDEAKFNKMTEESSLSVKQISEDSQHSSTPNVGVVSNFSLHNSDKFSLKNLGCLNLHDPLCRERIEKYKEERRTFLRDKYRSESFRAVSNKTEDDGEEALLTRLKQRASRPALH